MTTATFTPPQLDPADLESPSETTGRPPIRRRWRRRLLRVALAFAALLAIGNLFILAASVVAKTAAASNSVTVPDDVAAINNFSAIDAHLWRGGAPGFSDYRALAAAGVTTVIDLRAEEDLDVPFPLLQELGLSFVAIPIRDGQTPTTEQVRRFLEAVDASEGPVYLHCGAGVGRTGTMAAVYQVSRGGGGWEAMRDNLAVGPPSLEQLAFAAKLDAGETPTRPGPALVAVSRTLDAPRRLWKVLEGL